MYYDGVDSAHAMQISDYLPSMWTPIGAEAGELPGSIVMFVEGFEVKGHFAIGQATRALDLIRLSWGWNLRNPFGTQSTFVEGYKIDGSWRYRDDSYSKNGSYTAHSLGWSTGPTDALVSYVVGLQPIAPGGAVWTLSPQYGDLMFAEGGFTLPSGKFSSGWKLKGRVTELWLDVPEHTTGSIALPTKNGQHPLSVSLDNRELSNEDGTTVGTTTIHCDGGKHHLLLIY